MSQLIYFLNKTAIHFSLKICSVFHFSHFFPFPPPVSEKEEIREKTPKNQRPESFICKSLNSEGQLENTV